MHKTFNTPSNTQKQAIKPQFIITQDMLARLFEKNSSPAHYAADEIATAILVGCRIEHGQINLSLEIDQQGYQRLRLNLSQK